MEEVLQTFYQCGICEEPITYPKKLKCQHVFCHECLVVYITEYFGKPSFPCPVCHYKHLPEEQETMITQDALLILEEDSLMRDVRRFFKDGEEPQPIYNADGINRVTCTIHTSSLCGYFCPDCNMLVCTKCKQELHPRCQLRQIDKSMRMEAYNDIRNVSADLEDFLSEADTIHTRLISKVENTFQNSRERLETIESYYSDLKEKVAIYLEEQQEKVLKKAMELEEKEKVHLKNDIGICSKMATSVGSRQRLANSVQERSSTNAAENLVVINHLRNDFEGFKQMLSKLKSDVNTDYNVRFIINTELEDKMTNADIVKIEIIESCHSDASAVTFEEEAGVDQQALASSSIRRQAHEEATPPPPPDDDEPLPTYASVVRQSFMQRRRPFNTSVVRRKNSASAPPLPTYHDLSTPSASSWPSHQNPQPSYPTNVDQSPCHTPQLPPLQPSAPPMSYAASFSQPSSIQYEPLHCPFDPIPPGARTITMLKYRSEIDTKTEADNTIPSLVGIAMLGECFVIVDQANRCLKLVKSESRKIIDQYNFGRMEPWDVASVTDMLCVATCPKEGKLLFVDFSSLASAVPATLQKTIKSGKYVSIDYCKTHERFVCGRGPPFSAARVDILNNQGKVMNYISLKNSLAVPRCLTIAAGKFLTLCDVRNHVAMVYDIEHPRKEPVVLRRYEFHSLKEPQGTAVLPMLKSVLVLDATSGSVYVMSHSGHMRKCLDGDISLEPQGNTETKYSISISLDQRILAVAQNKGTVKFYEIKYL